MNYEFLLVRAIFFAFIYFGIYTTGFLGMVAFLPLYLTLTVYGLLIAYMVIITLIMPNALVLAARNIKAKGGDGYKNWTMYCIIDIGTFILAAMIMSFNGFAGLAVLMHVFTVIAGANAITTSMVVRNIKSQS